MDGRALPTRRDPQVRGPDDGHEKHDYVAPMSPLAREALERARPDIVSSDRWVFPAPKDPAGPVGYRVMKR